MYNFGTGRSYIAYNVTLGRTLSNTGAPIRLGSRADAYHCRLRIKVLSGEGEEEPLRWAGGNKRALVGPLGLVFMKFIVGVYEQLFTNFR